MKPSLSLALPVLAAAALAGCASDRAAMGAGPAAVTTTTVTAAPAVAVAVAPARLAAPDLQFVSVAAGSGMYEVEAARVAVSKAADPQVRAYAQMLVDHHTANNAELMALVSAKGHRVAPGLPAPLQQKVNTLNGLSGPAFDREFVRTTGVADHMAAINAFEQNRRTVLDRDLQAFIDKTLPVLRSHLQQAQDLAGRMAG
jgi:putative membrane protein